MDGFPMPPQIFGGREVLSAAYNVTKRLLMGFLVVSGGFRVSFRDEVFADGTHSRRSLDENFRGQAEQRKLGAGGSGT